MERVKTEASLAKMAAVPLPWWTSVSTTMARAIFLRVAGCGWLQLRRGWRRSLRRGRVGVVEAAADVAAEAVLEGGFGCGYGAAGG